MIEEYDKPQILPFEVNLIITSKNDLPCLEIRRATSNQEVIKQIIHAAFQNQPIVVQPKFTDKFRAINSLMEKGILYKKENDFFFNI